MQEKLKSTIVYSSEKKSNKMKELQEKNKLSQPCKTLNDLFKK